MVNERKLGLVGRIILAVGSFGTLFSGGCIDEYAAGGAALKGAASMSKSYGAGVAAYALGEAVQSTGQYNANERAAQAGRSQNNVYDGGNEDDRVNRNLPEIHLVNKPAAQEIQNRGVPMKPNFMHLKVPETYCCNGFFDENSDGNILNEEFKNIKGSFRSGEPLALISWWYSSNNNLAGKEILLEIIGLDTGKRVSNSPIPVNNRVDGAFYAFAKYETGELKNYLGGNHFKAVWNLNGTPTKFDEFTIE